MSFKLIKPMKLNKGDKVATVSLSWGGAGDDEILWRYEQGKERLQNIFGLEVVEMPHTLKGSEFIYNNPKKRAEDLMMAFSDKSIKGIFSCIGGEESIRMLPYIDFNIIGSNPKVFIGYSDSTTTHLICLKAGLSSFYGASVLNEFAENVRMHDYTVKYVNKTLFSNEPIGKIESPEYWTSERVPWLIENKYTERKMQPNTGYELLQGTGIAQGRLIGGCVEVLEMAKQTSLWPSDDVWKGAVLFLETSEDMPEPTYVEYWLRNYGTQGILNKINGIIWGKPYNNKYYDEYKEVIYKILRELKLNELPVLYNVSFGHTLPMTVIPYGALAEINCEESIFSILESGVI
ncbi:LD-carboxypeptidase [Sedimentibacter hydroxybenzoicus DSM 7310]|uniref:LD-carboxypeptidase n=1 Tax=Sedimentibacter hydroxybenzoicus DSM 7310 TaxID=1123245 RepID=A0A974BHI6_SEDHY|nr:S66 peptidase family protein [Sedimentibacter hydroxybenzoicus]NYB72971.1 LD-carboxypeptidase [Sedimentibacter hydroxybenzoicus DSM 7310]